MLVDMVGWNLMIHQITRYLFLIIPLLMYAQIQLNVIWKNMKKIVRHIHQPVKTPLNKLKKIGKWLMKF